jgi:hypothetical protein
MDVGRRVIEGVVEAEHVRTPFVIDNARMTPGGSRVGIHDHSLVFPGPVGLEFMAYPMPSGQQCDA